MWARMGIEVEVPSHVVLYKDKVSARNEDDCDGLYVEYTDGTDNNECSLYVDSGMRGWMYVRATVNDEYLYEECVEIKDLIATINECASLIKKRMTELEG